jgi:hypothetical protein
MLNVVSESPSFAHPGTVDWSPKNRHYMLLTGDLASWVPQEFARAV